MRWSVIRLIASRELKDQLRDRRTTFLILGLPVLMYPLFIGLGSLFVSALNEKKFIVGVVGAEFLPSSQIDVDISPAAIGGGPASFMCNHMYRDSRAFPPLIVDGKFAEQFLKDDPEGAALAVKILNSPSEDVLSRRQADALLIVEKDFLDKLERGERPNLRVLGREGEENSKLAVRRLLVVLHKWEAKVKAARFDRHGLPANFDSPVEIKDPSSDKELDRKVIDELRDGMVKIIPFLLMMWMLTGAIYPAIDMTAGEKERGTMETLLISPAERAEIVWGKFTTVVVMGFGTAIWNVILMLIAAAVAPLFAKVLAGRSLLSFPGLAACILAAIPLAMLIAACGLALGVFARSTKEGNYYMVPMFFVALPLSYLSMSPGMELDGLTSWIPVTNALLLQQRLLSIRADEFPWRHIPAVIISLSICIAVALWSAVRQFHRESVLFREVEAGGHTWSIFRLRRTRQ